MPPAPDATTDEIVHRLPRDPAHLYQRSQDPPNYNNPMGCGAFCTSMALSFYNPERYGNYGAPRAIFGEMVKVPFFGGTFEGQNASIAKKHGFFAAPFDHGKVTDLAAAIDHGAPTIMLVDPGRFGIGRHDVLLVGYSVDANGNYINLFTNNPEVQGATLESPLDEKYPGNYIIPVSTLPTKWTGCFTPFFSSAEAFASWRAQVGRR
ncbi:MAG TPA: papain-like cysteine protease family protein [Chloroflexia bacterium]|nr:papain-like cysteine protease family protein [Chloroflexia bacterium]